MARTDIYNQKHSLELALIGLEKDEKIVSQNKKGIIEFLNYVEAEGLSLSRQVRYVYALKKVATFLGKPFKKATKRDMVSVVSKIEKEDTQYDTKRSEKECLKKFFKWIRNAEDDYPPEVKWIKIQRKKNQRVLPEHLITEDEVLRLAEACNNLRDQALILVLYDTGARVGEILSLRIGDIQFDKYGATLLVKGKTGPRRVRIIFSSKALSDWLNHHPERKNSQAPLWTSFETVGSREPLGYAALRKMLKSTATRSGIPKKVNPHSFRHARASNLANDLTEAQLKEHFGWVGDSRMASVYVHLSGRNMDNALLKISGIKTEDEVNGEEHKLKIKTCMRCQEKNSPTDAFCSRCGSPLDQKTAMQVYEEESKIDKVMDVLLEDPEIKAVLLRKLKSIPGTR